MSDDVVWVPPSYALEPGPYQGREAIRRGIDAYFEVFDRFEPRAERILPGAEPGVYLVLASTATRGRGSGVETTIDVAHLITVSDGRVVRIEVLPDRPQAFEKAGLPREY